MPDSPDLEPLFVRLYLDRHIMARLATDLRGRGFDVVRTEETGNEVLFRSFLNTFLKREQEKS